MTRYLLDTNVVSELRKPKPHGAVMAWVRGLRDHQILVPAMTIGELQAGAELARKQDPIKANQIESWIDQLTEAYEVLPMDARCFGEWGRIIQDKPNRLIEDAMIAATASVHNLTVATRNEADFRHFAVPIFNPFNFPREQ